MTKVVLHLARNIVSTLLEQEFGQDQHVLNKTAVIIVQRIRQMPKFLSWAMVFLTMVFEWSGFILSGKRFSSKTLSEQNEQIERWRDSRLSVCRDVVQFYEKMTVFIYCSLMDSPVTDRQRSGPT